MMENSPEPQGLPTAEEQELKELLDRVLAASTVQPLREDLGRLLPEVEDLVAKNVSAAQKRITHHVTLTTDQLRERVEAELDALKRRLTERIEDTGLGLHNQQLQEFSSIKDSLVQLDAAVAKNSESLNSRIDALEVSSQERFRSELMSALQSTSQELISSIEQFVSNNKESFEAIQSQQLHAIQQSLRWQEDSRTRDDRFELELREIKVQLQKKQVISQALRWATFVAVVAHGLTWAFFFFG
jgi:hypothetical protein